MNTELQNAVINFRLQVLTNSVNYYRDSYLPHLRETTGYNQYEHLDMAKKCLSEFTDSVNYFRQHGKFDLLELSRYDIANGLRAYAINQYSTACDFCENPLIRNKALRRCVSSILELRAILPEICIYSNRAIASSMKLF